MLSQSLSTFIYNYMEAYKKVLLVFAQQYSMRSYETGKYDIRSDGNLKSVLNVIEQLKNEPFGDPIEITITVPLLEQLKNGQADIDWLLAKDDRIQVELVEYHENALQNRLKGIKFDREGYVSLLVTYFDVEPNSSTIFLCPGSPRPENTIYSEDEAPWFRRQVENAVATFYFNRNQNRFGFGEKCFEIEGVVKSAENDANAAWATALPGLIDDLHYRQMKAVDIYFPYRLTDKDYRFRDWLDLAISSGKGLGVTDPNNSLDKLGLSVFEKSFITKLDPANHLLHLAYIKKMGFPGRDMQIAWASDLRNTLHMGPVEMWSMFREDQHVFTFLEEQFTPEDIVQIFHEAERAAI